jgi:hypothetical protein
LITDKNVFFEVATQRANGVEEESKDLGDVNDVPSKEVLQELGTQ